MPEQKTLEPVRGWTAETGTDGGELVAHLAKREPGLTLRIRLVAPWFWFSSPRAVYFWEVIRSDILHASGTVFEQADAVFAANLMASVYADAEEPQDPDA